MWVRTLKIWLSVLLVNMITCPLVNLSFFCNFHFFYLSLYGSAFVLNYMKEEKNISRTDKDMKNFKLCNWQKYYYSNLIGSELKAWRYNIAWLSTPLFSILIRKWDVAWILSKVWVFHHKEIFLNSLTECGHQHIGTMQTHLADVIASDRTTKVFKIVWRVLKRLKNLFCGILKKS